MLAHECHFRPTPATSGLMSHPYEAAFNRTCRELLLPASLTLGIEPHSLALTCEMLTARARTLGTFARCCYAFDVD